MKDNHDRLKKAKRTVALVHASSISIERAINVALSSIGGTVFDAHLKEVDGQVVWRVKLLTSEGRVKMYIDGHSGRVLAAKVEIVVDESYGRISLDAAVTRPVPILKPLPRYGASAS
jgi:uncharacterized membrane protein YkoI